MLKKEKSDGKSHFYCIFLNLGSKFMTFSDNCSISDITLLDSFCFLFVKNLPC